MKSLKKDQIITPQNLGTKALTYTTSLPSKDFKLEQVILKASQAISETITITLIDISNQDTNVYDVVLQEVVLVAETDFVYRPQGQANFKAGDQIKVECTDTGGIGTVTGKVKTSEVAY